jgi:hypothetical protein
MLPLQVEPNCRREIARLHPVEQLLNVDHLAAGRPRDSGPLELRRQERDVESAPVERQKVTVREALPKVARDSGERRLVGHVGVGDAVDGGGRRRDGHARVEARRVVSGQTVREDDRVGDLDNAVGFD